MGCRHLLRASLTQAALEQASRLESYTLVLIRRSFHFLSVKRSLGAPPLSPDVRALKQSAQLYYQQRARL
eukprot:3841293-Pleurochrysis_carterae.AAC.2